jgi:hypothetical protein
MVWAGLQEGKLQLQIISHFLIVITHCLIVMFLIHMIALHALLEFMTFLFFPLLFNPLSAGV